MAKSIFKTERKENLKSRIKRFSFNLFPAYRGTGGRVCFISSDYKEVHIKLGLNWRTKNYVGTVFGGSIYGALDPIYMTQLIKILGDEYIIWDKSATIKFVKPITKTVYARFIISDELIEEIKSKVAKKKKLTIELNVAYQDEDGIIYAESLKTLFIGNKSYFNDLMKKRTQQKI